MLNYKAFKDGNSIAFAKIYDCFRKPILKYVLGRISNTQAAEEVTQEIFTKVFRFRESYDEAQEFSAWLWTIARNTVFDTLRKHKAGNEHMADAHIPFDYEEVPSEDSGIESALHLKDMRRMTKAAFRDLTKLQRRVFWLRVVKQYSYDEIANAMGMSLSAVKNLGHRAKVAAMESFSQMPEFAMA